jgi:rubrerythrin
MLCGASRPPAATTESAAVEAREGSGASPSLDSMRDIDALYDDEPRPNSHSASATDVNGDSERPPADSRGDGTANSAEDASASYARWPKASPGDAASTASQQRTRWPNAADGHDQASTARAASQPSESKVTRQHNRWGTPALEDGDPHSQPAASAANASQSAAPADTAPPVVHPASDPAVWAAATVDVAKQTDFVDKDGRRWVRWFCDGCKKLNTNLFGAVAKCTGCAAEFRGLRPWMCLGCGQKNSRQRIACMDCKRPRSVGLLCKRCGVPHSIFNRWCPSCEAWGQERTGFNERLVGRTASCPSCGCVADVDSNTVAKISPYCDGRSLACHACGASYSFKENVRKTMELPMLPWKATPLEVESGDATRRRPIPRRSGATAFTTSPDDTARGNHTAARTDEAKDADRGRGPSRWKAATEPAAKEPAPWQCQLCGTSNPNASDTCSQCFDRRPSEATLTEQGGNSDATRSTSASKQQSWRCPLCRTLQPPGAVKCIACGKGERPTTTKTMHMVRGDWPCPTCRYVNFATRAVCKACKTYKPTVDETGARDGSDRRSGGERGGRTSARDASWRCVLCRHVNIRRGSTCCAVCGTDALTVRGAKGSPKIHTVSNMSGEQAEKQARGPPAALRSGRDEVLARLWTCPVCDQRNQGTAAVCALCEAGRPASEMGSSTAAAADTQALPQGAEDAAAKAAADDKAPYRCPFCAAPQTKAVVPEATEGGGTEMVRTSPCHACGRSPDEVVAGVWFCGNATCEERGSLEMHAPEVRGDGAVLLPTLGTWNAATRTECSRCSTARVPDKHHLLQYLTRCQGCKTPVPGSSVTSSCPACGHSPLRRLGDFPCSVCRAENFSNRLYCRSCHRQRNPRYVFIDREGHRIRSAGLPEDDQWAQESLAEPRNKSITAKAVAADQAESAAVVPGELPRDTEDDDDASHHRQADRPATERTDDLHPDSGESVDLGANAWECRLCGSRNAATAESCGSCGVDR